MKNIAEPTTTILHTAADFGCRRGVELPDRSLSSRTLNMMLVSLWMMLFLFLFSVVVSPITETLSIDDCRIDFVDQLRRVGAGRCIKVVVVRIIMVFHRFFRRREGMAFLFLLLVLILDQLVLCFVMFSRRIF